MGAPGALDEDAAVFDRDPRVGRGLEVEPTAGDLVHRRVELHHIQPRVREQRLQGRGDGAAAQPDHQDALRLRVEVEAGQHHLGVFEHQPVGLAHQLAGLASEPPARTEQQASLVAVLGDEQVAVERTLLVQDVGRRAPGDAGADEHRDHCSQGGAAEASHRGLLAAERQASAPAAPSRSEITTPPVRIVFTSNQSTR